MGPRGEVLCPADAAKALAATTYDSTLKVLDFHAVMSDLDAMMVDSQECWPSGNALLESDGRSWWLFCCLPAFRSQSQLGDNTNIDKAALILVVDAPRQRDDSLSSVKSTSSSNCFQLVAGSGGYNTCPRTVLEEASEKCDDVTRCSQREL